MRWGNHLRKWHGVAESDGKISATQRGTHILDSAAQQCQTPGGVALSGKGTAQQRRTAGIRYLQEGHSTARRQIVGAVVGDGTLTCCGDSEAQGVGNAVGGDENVSWTRQVSEMGGGRWGREVKPRHSSWLHTYVCITYVMV